MRSRPWLAGGVLLVAVSAVAQTGSLRIVVVAGEDAVNIVQQRTAVAPVVEVRDRNDNPVAGVLVTFSIQGGQNATFSGGLQTLTLTTNAAGRAAVTGLTPTGSGALHINVAAAFQGQTATATIAQTNFATVAQAAQATASGSSGSGGATAGGAGSSGGGGLSATTVAAIAGGAGAGAYIGLKEAGVLGARDIPAPIITGAFAFPNPGLQSATTIDFGYSGEVSGNENRPDATMVWEFGDGATSTTTVGGPGAPERITHVYNSAGTFTVRVTITNDDGDSATGQTTITIKSMTGRWTLGGTSGFYDFTQSAGTLSGTFTAGSTVRSLTGSVRATSPHVTWTESTGVTFTGVLSFDINSVSGTLNGGGFLNQAAGITRQ